MPTVALSMIVRDARQLLAACIESVRGAVDEMVLADTGSVDDTVEVARQLGARVISIPWKDDFSGARNLALAEVKSDWVLSLDADEQLDPSAARLMQPLLKHATASGFAVTIRNYMLSLDERVWDRPAKPNDSGLATAKKYPAYVEHENIRLFRHRPEIYFEGRVHETVGHRIEALGEKLGTAPFCIHHFGLAADTEVRARKNRFYRKLGRQKIREMPGNAQAHFELGLVELDNFGNLAEALDMFEGACKLSPGFGLAWFFRGLTLLKLERFEEAIKSLADAEKLGQRTALVAETRGDALYNLKRYSDACQSYEVSVRREPSNPNLESKLGMANVRIGKVQIGLEKIRHAIKRKPGAGELHDRLILALVLLERFEEAALAGEAKLESVERPLPSDFLRTASVWAKLGDLARAAAWLQKGMQAYPRDGRLEGGLREVAKAAGKPNQVSCVNSTI